MLSLFFKLIPFFQFSQREKKPVQSGTGSEHFSRESCGEDLQENVSVGFPPGAAMSGSAEQHRVHSQGVNFINILFETFLHEIVLRSFYLIKFCF